MIIKHRRTPAFSSIALAISGSAVTALVATSPIARRRNMPPRVGSPRHMPLLRATGLCYYAADFFELRCIITSMPLKPPSGHGSSKSFISPRLERSRLIRLALAFYGSRESTFEFTR